MQLRNLLLVVLFAAAICGCKDRTESDRGRVNVGVNTPGGNVGVDVTYPKDKDDSGGTRVKIDHD